MNLKSTASYRQPSYGSTSTIPPAKLGSGGENDRPILNDTLDDDRIPMGVLDGRIHRVNYMLGTSILLPWTALATAAPYFLERLEGSRLQAPFLSYFNVTYTIMSFAFIGHATLTVQKASPSRRLRFSLGILAAINLLLALSPGVALDPTALFTFIMLITALQAIALSYLRTAIVSVASAFGPSAVQAVMSGESIIGVVVSIVQYFTAVAAELSDRAVVDSGTKAAASVSFGLSTAFLACSLASHTWMMRVSSYRSVIQGLESGKCFTEEDSVRTEDVLLTPNAPERGEIMKVAQINWKCNFAVAYNSVLLMAVFPPITSAIRPVNPISSGMFFSPVLFNYFHFLVMCASDFVGRLLCSHPRLITWSQTKLLKISLARTAFIPLFLLCNFQRPGDVTHHAAPFINSDIMYLLILAAFGVSYGYLMTLCMMAASSTKHNPKIRSDQVSSAATIAQFCTIGGLTLGSFVSFGVTAVVCKCNPFY